MLPTPLLTVNNGESSEKTHTPLTPLTPLNMLAPLTPLTPDTPPDILTPVTPETPLDILTPFGIDIQPLKSPDNIKIQHSPGPPGPPELPELPELPGPPELPESLLLHMTTCFIIDWDDTLLSTTFLTSLLPLTSVLFSPTQLVSLLPPDVIQQLEELEHTLFTFFDELQHLGDVFIITNSQRGWVELCCRQFIPRVWTWLKNFQIISARFDHESTFPNDPYMWKCTAFQKCIQRRHRSIVSFGDCPNDQKITCKIGKDNGLQTKFFKFVHGQPNVSALNKQLASVIYIIRNVHNSFPDFIVQLSADGFYKFTHGTS